jgi:hypothetical protein
MSALASYSIESDELVLLYFKDGSHRRVGQAELAQLLLQDDLAQVQRGFQKRAAFVSASLPTWARSVVLAVGTIALAVSTVKATQVIWNRVQPQPQEESQSATGNTNQYKAQSANNPFSAQPTEPANTGTQLPVEPSFNPPAKAIANSPVNPGSAVQTAGQAIENVQRNATQTLNSVPALLKN